MRALRRTGLEVAGVRTPAIEAGPREASEAVVFVHGNPGSSSDWAALVQATGELGRALALDMPGFGKATAPAGFAYEVGSYARFLEDACLQLGIERVHLVVHDFGGPFALRWGLEHPRAWASVVLINIGVMPGYEWHSLAKLWRTPLLGELAHAWIPRWGWRRTMQRSSPRGLPEQFVDRMYDDYDRATRNTVLALYRATPDPGALAIQTGAALAELRKPALVVWGASDPYIGVQCAERQREFFAVEHVAILPDSGHWPFQDDPQRVHPLVLDFLRRQLALSETDPPRPHATAQPLPDRPEA
jgi:pimeloyl-ACP methyl ester carboxylesterase